MRSAQSIIEVLVGVAIGAILIIAGVAAIAPALQGNKQAGQIEVKAQLASELAGNVTSWAAGNWNNVLSTATGSLNTYYIIASASPFVATSGAETVTVGSSSYTRYFYLTDVYRNSGGNATTSASGNSYDPSTKFVTVVYGVASSTTSTVSFYLTRNQDNSFAQSSWSGGSGSNGPITLSSNKYASSSVNISTALGSVTLTGGGGGPAGSGQFVQGAIVANDGASATIAAVFPQKNTAGDLIVATISWGTTAAVPTAVTDSAGNTYSLATSTKDTNDTQYLAVYYAQNIVAATNTVNVKWSSTRAYRHFTVIEYSGIAATNALDVTHGNFQSTCSQATDGTTSGAATTASSGDLIFGTLDVSGGDFNTGTTTAGTGETLRTDSDEGENFTEDKTQSSAGSVSSTFTSTACSSTIAIMAAFR